MVRVKEDMAQCSRRKPLRFTASVNSRILKKALLATRISLHVFASRGGGRTGEIPVAGRNEQLLEKKHLEIETPAAGGTLSADFNTEIKWKQRRLVEAVLTSQEY